MEVRPEPAFHHLLESATSLADLVDLLVCHFFLTKDLPLCILLQHTQIRTEEYSCSSHYLEKKPARGGVCCEGGPHSSGTA